MSFAQTFGLRLCHARLALGWTQEQLADKSGVSRSVIANSERGDNVMGVERARALADALGVTLDDLTAPEEVTS